MSDGAARAIYAIGDVHGRDQLLERLHDRIANDPYRAPSPERPLVVHLGDYIDRGPDSIAVIDRIMRGSDAFETAAVLGNHEDMLLGCLDTDELDEWRDWVDDGGEQTLAALGISFRRDGPAPAELADRLGPERVAWLRGLPLYHQAGGYLFVHAGIVPGYPLSEQKRKDLLWIRSAFLRSEADHGYVVVHGHTPTPVPEARHNRIGIDTSRVQPSTLTAVALEPEAAPRFLQVSDDA